MDIRFTCKLALSTMAIALVGATVPVVAPAFSAPTDRAIAAAPATSQKIAIHLSRGTDDLHAVFMALKLGTGLLKQGAQVTLILTIEGVRIADTRQPLNLRWGQGSMTVDDLYREFVNAGGKVMVCPICAAAVGLTPQALRPGAQLAEGTNDIPRLILAADKVLDY